jgi:hypothetical protein
MSILMRIILERCERNKLATLLATDVIENEYKWINYDFEESQVKIDISDMILEFMLSESINLCDLLEEPSRNTSIYRDTDAITKISPAIPLLSETNRSSVASQSVITKQNE